MNRACANNKTEASSVATKLERESQLARFSASGLDQKMSSASIKDRPSASIFSFVAKREKVDRRQRDPFDQIAP